jgi:hypothetical protein
MSRNIETDWRFCPALHRPPRRQHPEGRGACARPACPACGFVLYLNPARGGVHDSRPSDGGDHPGPAAASIPSTASGRCRVDSWDRGETLPAAAVRETREEIKVRVALTGILDVYSFPGQDTVVAVLRGRTCSPARRRPGTRTLEVKVFAPEAIPGTSLASTPPARLSATMSGRLLSPAPACPDCRGPTGRRSSREHES